MGNVDERVNRPVERRFIMTAECFTLKQAKVFEIIEKQDFFSLSRMNRDSTRIRE
jgi:hypothetical protein